MGYPHGCGEQESPDTRITTRSGLSPRGRGTRATHRPPPWAQTVYPRGRGEHFHCVRTAHVHRGLSPRTRGTRRQPRPRQAPAERRSDPAPAPAPAMAPGPASNLQSAAHSGPIRRATDRHSGTPDQPQEHGRYADRHSVSGARQQRRAGARAVCRRRSRRFRRWRYLRYKIVGRHVSFQLCTERPAGGAEHCGQVVATSPEADHIRQ